jgi:hypothetical protein
VRAVTTYCAPCLADLALVREATTAVGGTASCMAHAVLLTHPHDDPQRRRQRLAQLRDTATEKLETAGPEEQLRLEVLVEEYGLASAMESLVPRRRPDDGRQPGEQGRKARKRRGREQRGERPERPGGAPFAAEQAAPGSTSVSDGAAEQAGAQALEQVGAPSGEPPAPSASEPSPSEPDAGSAPTAAPSEPSEPDAGPAPAPPTAAPADPDAGPTGAGARPPSLIGEAAPATSEPPATTDQE